MAAFQVARVKEAVWPEALGVGSYVAGELVMAQVDTAMNVRFKGYPITQTALTAVSLVGSIWAIGKGKAVGFFKGVLYGAAVGLIVNLTRSLYEWATKKMTRMRVRDMGALVAPRVVGKLPAGKGGIPLDVRVEVPRVVEAGAGLEVGPVAVMETRRGM